MSNLPGNVEQVIKVVNHCCKEIPAKTFLFGDLALAEATGKQQFLVTNNIDLIVASKHPINTFALYKRLVQHIVINREVENAGTFFHFVSNEFNVRIHFHQDFDPNNLEHLTEMFCFNLDAVLIDAESLSAGIAKHPLDTLVNLRDPLKWTIEDALGFCKWLGKIPELSVDSQQMERLRSLSLSGLRESTHKTPYDHIEEILLLRHSGAALKFLVETFADGGPWCFRNMVDYLVSMGVTISDECNIDSLFNDKKYEIIDLYNEFFLSERKIAESPDDVQHRLTTIVKILFDSPHLDIPRPYIARVRTMAGGILGRCCLGSDVGGSIAFFGCGNNVEEEDCLGYTVNCNGDDPCLREHPSFAHIPDANWDILTVDFREWCPNQVCPDANNIHCLQPGGGGSAGNPVEVEFGPTKDTWIGISDGIDQGNKDTQLLRVSASQSPSVVRRRSLLYFDISSIPPGSTIQTSTLYGRKTNTGTGAGTACKCYRLTQIDWSETESGWNNYSSGNAWTTPGGDYLLASAVNWTIPGGGTNAELQITGLAQMTQDALDQIGGHLHILLVVEDEAAGEADLSIYDKENVSPDHRPKLVVSYT